MSNVQYNLLAGFKAINAWQQNIIRNAQGLITPGYNRINLRLSDGPGGNNSTNSQATASGGSTNGLYGGGDSLSLAGQSIGFEQGELTPTDSPTALAVKGQGFFVLAENLAPGAKLFVSRAGDFHYDQQGRLVNSQGLFVVGGGGVLSDPPLPVRNPGDGTVVLSDLTMARIPVPGNLGISLYGSTVYETNPSSGALQALPNGDTRVGFVQPNTLEFMSRVGNNAQLQLETNQASQTYKLIKDMLDNYNRAADDAIGLVK